MPVAALCEHLGFVYARQLVESWVFPVPFHAKFRERDILWWVPDRVLDVTNGPLHKLNGGTERFESERKLVLNGVPSSRSSLCGQDIGLNLDSVEELVQSRAVSPEGVQL